MKKCPFCAELIQDEAALCRFCGRSVTEVKPKSDPRWLRFAEEYRKLSAQDQMERWRLLTPDQQNYCTRMLRISPPPQTSIPPPPPESSPSIQDSVHDPSRSFETQIPPVADFGSKQYNLEINEVILAGWRGMKKHLAVGLGVVLVFMIIEGIGSTIPVINVLYAILFMFPLNAGMALISVKIGDSGSGRSVDVGLGDLFSGFRKFGTTLGAGWIQMLVIGMLAGAELLAGAVLAAVFGAVLGEDVGQIVTAIMVIILAAGVVYVAIRLMFTFYLVLDQHLGAVDSMKRSWAITNGNVFSLCLLMLFSLVVVLGGLILFIVGILPATVFVLGMFGATYRRLVGSEAVSYAVSGSFNSWMKESRL